MKIRLRWTNPWLRALLLAAMLLLLAIYAGDGFRFVYQAY